MGRAYALAFAARGAKLALNDWDAKALAETAALLPEDRVFTQAFDVSSPEAMQQFAEAVEQQLGKAHVIINNAGIEGAQKPAWALSVAEHERIFAVNYYGVVNGTTAFLPQLMAHGDEAAVVNVSSIFGLAGTPNNADYCATKFAVRGYTEALMAELHESPVEAYIVHPGGIDTNIVRSDEGQDFRQKYLTTPPQDIAEYVIKCLAKRRLRVVYGKGSWKTYMGTRFAPLRLLKSIIWKELKPYSDVSQYPHSK